MLKLVDWFSFLIKIKLVDWFSQCSFDIMHVLDVDNNKKEDETIFLYVLSPYVSFSPSQTWTINFKKLLLR